MQELKGRNHTLPNFFFPLVALPLKLVVGVVLTMPAVTLLRCAGLRQRRSLKHLV